MAGGPKKLEQFIDNQLNVNCSKYFRLLTERLAECQDLDENIVRRMGTFPIDSEEFASCLFSMIEPDEDGSKLAANVLYTNYLNIENLDQSFQYIGRFVMPDGRSIDLFVTKDALFKPDDQKVIAFKEAPIFDTLES